MRTGKVCCLLLSVLQFILFLKLVEFVRGEELQVSSSQLEKVSEENAVLNDTKSNPTDNGRGLFIAPRIKRKKLRLWNGENATISKRDGSSNIVAETLPLNIDKDKEDKSDQKIETFFETKDEDNHPNGRLCPGCANNQCPITDPISSGFPIVPIIIAVAVGILWFIKFLILWVFYIKPEKKQQSGGYGSGGYDSPSPQPGWGSSTSDQDSSFLGGIFDNLNFFNSKRSFESYSQLLNVVLDSVNTLTTLYNGD